MKQDINGNWSHKPGLLPVVYLEEGMAPDDISWDYYATNGKVLIEGFYDSETKYVAIQD